MRRLGRMGMAAVVVGWVVLGSGRGEAAFLTYIETVGTTTGSLGSTNFNDSTVTFTATADTSNVFQSITVPGLYEVLNISVTVSITGGRIFGSTTSANVTDATDTFSNQGFAYGGISIASSQLVIARVSSSSFSTYDLRSTFGPASGSATSIQHTVGTDQGTLILDGNLAFGGATGTFTASPATVPEPPSIALGGIAAGLIGLGYARSRGRHAATPRTRPSRRSIGEDLGPGIGESAEGRSGRFSSDSVLTAPGRA